jgi:integral membrane protein
MLPPTDHRFLHRLRLLGLTEGVSTLILFFVAMPLKYLGGMPVAVTIGGSIHGFLFLALVTMLALAVKRVPISRRLAGAGIVGAILPFGPFIVDRWLGGVGRRMAG